MSARHLTISCVFLALLATARAATAGGLIYQLPPDGSWVRYDLREDAQCDYDFGKNVKLPDAVKDSLPRKIKLRGSLTISSVGQADVKGEACRWIEMKLVIASTGEAAKEPGGEPRKNSRQLLLKLLIPEKHLRPRADPFAHVVKMYFWDRDRDPEEITDGKAKKYELDRFRPLFPKPVANTERLAKQLVNTTESTLGRLECERVTFTSKYAGPLARGIRGWWSWQGEHQVWLHSRVPFGVASLKWTGMSEERNNNDPAQSITVTVKSTRRLVVSEIGTDAKSALPQHN